MTRCTTYDANVLATKSRTVRTSPLRMVNVATRLAIPSTKGQRAASMASHVITAAILTDGRYELHASFPRMGPLGVMWKMRDAGVDVSVYAEGQRRGYQ